MTIESVLIFSVIVEAIVIIALLILTIIIILLITKRLSELSTALKELMNTLKDKSGKLLDQATSTIKAVENSLANEKESSVQSLIRNIVKNAAFIFEIISIFKNFRKGGNKDGKGSG
jgi:Sec-independent protein translocase protein TatA